MPLPISDSEFKLFQQLIESLCGIALPDNKAYLVRHRLSELAELSGCPTFQGFYDRVTASDVDDSIRSDLIDAITIQETSWFRNAAHFDVLRDELFPQLYDEVRAGKRKKIRIWSAACASGQEPYSIVMAAMQFYRTMGGPGACRDQVSVFASDISRRACATAMSGHYDEASMKRGLAQDLWDRHFHEKDGRWHLDEGMRDYVHVRPFNLMESPDSLGTFDIVFLRNIVIYFSEEVKVELFGRIANVLAPGGYLFLGTGETVCGYSKDFEIVSHGSATYYRKPGGPA